jgi:hypothetical protein
MTINELIFELVSKGGAIVSTTDCSNHEIVNAQVNGRFAVTDDGLGFVRRPKEWLEINKNREIAHPNVGGRFDTQPTPQTEGSQCAATANPTTP